MGTLSRTKGHAWECRVARDMTKARGVKYDTSRAVAPHRDHEGVDVLSADDPFVVQCKVGREPRVRAALEEAVSGARPGEIPVVAAKWNRGNGRRATIAAVLPWSVWLGILQKFPIKE